MTCPPRGMDSRSAVPSSPEPPVRNTVLPAAAAGRGGSYSVLTLVVTNDLREPYRPLRKPGRPSEDVGQIGGRPRVESLRREVIAADLPEVELDDQEHEVARICGN